MKKKSESLTPISSAHIHSAGYDPVERVMTVRFHNGYTYKIHGVEPTAYRNFMAASSQGEFYHTYFKNNYRIERV